MQIIKVISDLQESNMYIIEENGHGLIIDPCSDISGLKDTIHYDWILLTHEHYDHISGVDDWREKTFAKVICSEACEKGMMNPTRNMSKYYNTFADLQSLDNGNNRSVTEFICKADETFRKKKTIIWQGHNIALIECPGHSAGSILIIFDDRIMFSGDSVFRDYPTECRFPGGNKKTWKESSLPIILNMNDDLLVYPGHFEEFLLKDKKWE